MCSIIQVAQQTLTDDRTIQYSTSYPQYSTYLVRDRMMIPQYPHIITQHIITHNVEEQLLDDNVTLCLCVCIIYS